MEEIIGSLDASGAQLPWGPRLYRHLQRLLAPGAEAALRAQLAAQLGDWVPTGPALDVGCGDASLLSSMGLAPIWGVDRAHDRLRAFDASGAAHRMADQTTHAICADATALPFADGSFGLSFCCGLLHHLDDAAAGRALAEMLRVTAPGGRLLVFDGVWPQSWLRRPLATLLRAADRGRHMRSEAALRALLGSACPGLRWHEKRFEYASTGLEGLSCTATLNATQPVHH